MTDPSRVAQALRRTATIGGQLGTLLETAAATLTTPTRYGPLLGELMLTRSWDWVPADSPPSSAKPTPGNEETDEAIRVTREGTPADEDHRLAAAAAKYHTEVTELFPRLHVNAQHLQRVHTLLPDPSGWAGYSKLVATLTADCHRVVALADVFYPQRPDRTAGGEPGCWSCARTHSTAGIPRWEPVHRTVSLNGRLHPPRPLCRPCGDFARRTGRVPTTVEVEAFHRASPKRWPKEHAA
jgi:hypothetical protein